MGTYIALLRGVNIGGNPLKMEVLRSVCSRLGFCNIRTYLQSGNVVFESPDSVEVCRQSLEAEVGGKTRLAPCVIIRTPKELQRLVLGNPFLQVPETPRCSRYVAFLAQAPSKSAIERLKSHPSGDDQWVHSGSQVYLSCPNGYARSALSNNILEKMLEVRATTRNWNTVMALHEMTSSKSGR